MCLISFLLNIFTRDFFERKILDEYLARALTLPLSEVTEVIYTSNGNGPLIEETRYKPLKLIDDSNYVLTLDFALKMINIHERKECGMPVIIEGETGVGKTALLRMLSKLWNYSYEIDLKSYIHRLKESLTYDESKKLFTILDRLIFVCKDKICHYNSGYLKLGMLLRMKKYQLLEGALKQLS